MLAMFGKVTGHAQVQATQRYTHQPDDPLRIRPEQLCDVQRGADHGCFLDTIWLSTLTI